MGGAIYLTRISGYWLAGRVEINRRVEAWLNYLPGCILISLVAPFFLHADWLEFIAGALTVILMWRTRNVLVAMVVGIAFVAIGRLFFP